MTIAPSPSSNRLWFRHTRYMGVFLVQLVLTWVRILSIGALISYSVIIKVKFVWLVLAYLCKRVYDEFLRKFTAVPHALPPKLVIHLLKELNMAHKYREYNSTYVLFRWIVPHWFRQSGRRNRPPGRRTSRERRISNLLYSRKFILIWRLSRKKFSPAVIEFKNEAEVVEMANNTTYGLAAHIFTDNVSTAIKVAHVVEAGSTWICHPFLLFCVLYCLSCFMGYHRSIARRLLNWNSVPFGGYKKSGVGRELGEDAPDTFVFVYFWYVRD